MPMGSGHGEQYRVGIFHSPQILLCLRNQDSGLLKLAMDCNNQNGKIGVVNSVTLDKLLNCRDILLGSNHLLYCHDI